MNRFRRPRDERGAILVLSVAGVVLAMICAGLAIDLGRLAQEGRENQKIADLAALDAARVLPASGPVIQQAATDSATRNGFPTTAGYIVDAKEGTKVGNGCQAQAGAGKVCVIVTSPFSKVLPYGVTPNVVTRTAVAGQNGAEAEFSVGSTLASLNTQETFLDFILDDWLGTSGSLSAVSYNGLASGNVTLLQLQQQLLSMGYAVGTPSGLMNSEIEVADLLTATSQALGTDQPTAKAEVDRILAATVNATIKMKLRDFVNVETPGSDDALNTSLNVFQLINGSAQAANGEHFVSIPGLSVSLPLNLSNLAVSLKVIEPAQTARGPVGTTARNAQVVLGLDFDLSVLTIGVVDVHLEYANATALATLTSACPSANPASIAISAQASGLTTTGTVVVPVGTLNVNGFVGASTASHTFGYPTDFGTPWRTGAVNVGIGNAVAVTGTGLLTNLAAAVVDPVLDVALAALDPALNVALRPVLQALGVEMAAADVTAIAMYQPPPFCGMAGHPGLLG